MDRPTILLSNDDGVNAPGLMALRHEMASIGRAIVVAPDRENSAASHSLTIDVPLRASRVEDDVISVEGTPSDCVLLAVEHLRLDAPGHFLAPTDFSCMGYSVPAAIGACFANPGRDVVALPGDGAFLMTGLELITASAHRAAPLVCVLHDGTLSQIAQFQKMMTNRVSASVLPDYDLEGFARVTGCRYFRIIRDSELDSVLPAALALTRDGTPALVEVAVDYSQKTYFTKGAVKTLFSLLPWGDRVANILRAVGRRLT